MPLRGIVHIIDDDPAVRKSLQMYLEMVCPQVREYASAAEFLAEFNFARSGCILLDLNMPGMSGIELLEHLKQAGNVLPVIVVSGYADVETAVRCMKLGCVDVLEKPFEPRTLVATVQDAMKESVCARTRREESAAVGKRFEELTTRERELLKLVVAGRSNKRIAADLHISIKTVANHRASLMAKTQAENAADLARLSVLAGVPTEVS